MALQKFLAIYTAGQLTSPKSKVLVAQAKTDLVVAFIKWESPSHPKKLKLKEDFQYSERYYRQHLNSYRALTKKAKKRSFGDKPYYSK
jgi:hypothetical protein